LFPEWIEIARRASQLYAAYGNAEYFRWSAERWLWMALPPLVVAAALNNGLIRSRNPALHRWVNALLLFAALAILLFVAQRRGWSYHAVPIKLVIGMALGACLVTAARSFTRPAIERAAVWSLAIVAAAAVLLSMTEARKLQKQAFLDTDLARVVSRLADPPVIAFFATSLAPAFPLVTELGLEWGSRFPCLWTLAGLRYQELQLQAGTQQNEEAFAQPARASDKIISNTVADLDRSAVDRRRRRARTQAGGGSNRRPRATLATRSFRAAWRRVREDGRLRDWHLRGRRKRRGPLTPSPGRARVHWRGSCLTARPANPTAPQGTSPSVASRAAARLDK
jgi:hypothetical protein